MPVSHREPSPADARARAYSVAILGLVSSAVFFLTGVRPLPVLLYFPLSRRFGFQSTGPTPLELSMDFYGRSLLALLAGLAAGLVTYAALQLFGRSPKPAPVQNRRLLLMTVYAMTAFAFAVSLFAYQLAMRVPTPLPMPVQAKTDEAR